jgi:hypothetical protein
MVEQKRVARLEDRPYYCTGPNPFSSLWICRPGVERTFAASLNKLIESATDDIQAGCIVTTV